jgi:hypothetical protein
MEWTEQPCGRYVYASLAPNKEQSMKLARVAFVALAAIVAAPIATPVLADNVRKETVHFAQGSSGSTIKSKVKGYDSVEYSLGVTAGQKLSVQLDSDNGSLYFNVNAPGAPEEMYNSSINGNGASIDISSSGTYVIQIYLMRNAARRGETANYTLTLYVE